MTTTPEIEAAARAAWERNREIVEADGMEMPTWDHAKVDVKQRWRENQRAALAAAALRAPVEPVARPGEEYHEDMGPALWWRFPIVEPPYVGHPNDCDWPGYHTHFTPIPLPASPPHTQEPE